MRCQTMQSYWFTLSVPSFTLSVISQAELALACTLCIEPTDHRRWGYLVKVCLCDRIYLFATRCRLQLDPAPPLDQYHIEHLHTQDANVHDEQHVTSILSGLKLCVSLSIKRTNPAWVLPVITRLRNNFQSVV